MKTNFHMKGWAPGLALKKRPKGIRKWPIELWLPCEEFCSFLTSAAGFSLSLTILTEDPHTKLLKFESLQIVQVSSNIISRRNNQNEIAKENDKTVSKTYVSKKYEVRINAAALCMQAK